MGAFNFGDDVDLGVAPILEVNGDRLKLVNTTTACL